LRPCARGFTLVELLTVITMVAIGTALALPSMRGVLIDQRLRATATDLMSSLLMARSEAIKRGAQVRVTPLSASAWTSGWQVAGVASGDLIDRQDALGDGVQVPRAPESVVYDRNGRLAGSGLTRIELSSSVQGPSRTRCITIEPGGLPRLANGTCP
jgi:type IV fimbrial biogenesis protein FimT